MDAEPPLFSAFLCSPCVPVRVRCLYKCSRGVSCRGQPFWRRRMFDVLRIPSTTPSTIGEDSFLLCHFIDRRLFANRRSTNVNCVYVPMCVEERNP
ncbi:uncharacterized protein [Zea mays]|uniref:uncharacterized protein n=1 Tax=Zea mays TaxID=4577 RepID=UPI001652ED25|nr:uncharacterized protein LOC118473318 [Zea mays]